MALLVLLNVSCSKTIHIKFNNECLSPFGMYSPFRMGLLFSPCLHPHRETSANLSSYYSLCVKTQVSKRKLTNDVGERSSDKIGSQARPFLPFMEGEGKKRVWSNSHSQLVLKSRIFLDGLRECVI